MMKKMSEAEVMDEILTSKKFADTFLNASDNIKRLFIDLACESSIYSCNTKGYAKSMTETGYRLAKPSVIGRKTKNYCMFTIRRNHITIDIRTDGNPISSETLMLVNKGDCYNGGFEWHRFNIDKDSDLAETLRSIEYCYKI